MPVETAPCFSDIVDDTKALALVEQALNAATETERANKVEEIGQLSNSESALKLYAKKLKGTTHREVFYPVAEQTLYYLKETNYANPALDSCGQIETPPSETGAPGPFTYRRCADKIFDDGTWLQRTQQWKGYESIDMDLYGSLAIAMREATRLEELLKNRPLLAAQQANAPAGLNLQTIAADNLGSLKRWIEKETLRVNRLAKKVL
ncbi:MAG: hypothetical protein PHI35_00615 [Victivallaceae bacterium]|nr:hypothetical protein [Victivallaceae bacterium]